jgi:hypothetical protein
MLTAFFDDSNIRQGPVYVLAGWVALAEKWASFSDRWRMVLEMRTRVASGVMTTLMRSDRDRRLGKPVKGHAMLERVLLVGTRSADHIRASGHSGCIATGQASTRKTGRIYGCTRTLRR